MFSIMTMASSTTKPVEIVNAIKVKLFRLNPIRYITQKVPTSDKGTETLGIMLAESVRKKRNITSTTRATVSINSNCTSLTEARIVVVRSVSTDTCTEDGKEAVSWGSNVFTRSTTVMMLAPGSRAMLRITAGAAFVP